MSEQTLERIKLAERRVYNVGSGVNPHMIAMEGQVLARALRAVEAENKRLREALRAIAEDVRTLAGAKAYAESLLFKNDEKRTGDGFPDHQYQTEGWKPES